MKLKQNKWIVSLLAALLMLILVASIAGAQGGVNVERARALLVELSATINQNLTVGQDVTVGDDLAVTGDAAVTGNLTVTGSLDGASGQTNSNWFKISAPTAIASATPAARINSAGANNDLLVVEKNSTPVFKIGNGGALTISGNATFSGTINGVKCYKGQQAVLGAATAIPATLTAAGITTPTWADQSFAASPGDTYWQTYHTNAAGVVTFGVHQRLLAGTVTPQAATTTVALDYEVCGN